MEPTEIILILLAISGATAQILAIIGKPKWAERVKVLSGALDGLAGNFGKAKNK